MKITAKKKKQRKKRIIGFNTYVFFSFFFFLFSINSFSQDSIPMSEDLTEEKELKFQQFFFKALSEKSIGNHQKAIENLENCNEHLENNTTVFFEFSKNYLQLNKTLLAKEYLNRALLEEPKNIWMLKHLVKIHEKDNNLSEAITIQKKVDAINLKERENLVRLYLRNREYKKAVSLMNFMERDNTLSSVLKKEKYKLEKGKKKTVEKDEKKDVISLKDEFKNNKSYAILKQILNQPENTLDELLKYAEEGIALFPAQPFVYLIKGKTLNNQKKYKKALLSLQDGIDFVIEDKLEVDFYLEMAISYNGLGDFKNEKKFIEKSKK